MTDESRDRPALRLRRMVRPDLLEVLAIERRSFSNPWPPSTFEGEIQNEGLSHPVVAVEETTGRIVGYVILWVIGDEAQINNIAVHPDDRCRGVAAFLLDALFASLREMGVVFASLEVREGNVSARALYAKYGFRTIGLRKDYYSKPAEDAVVMGLDLGPERPGQ